MKSCKEITVPDNLTNLKSNTNINLNIFNIIPINTLELLCATAYLNAVSEDKPKIDNEAVENKTDKINELSIKESQKSPFENITQIKNGVNSFIFYISSECGRLVIKNRSRKEETVQRLIEKVFLPSLFETRPDLKTNIINAVSSGRRIQLNIIGVDGSMQIGDKPDDWESKMEECFEFESDFLVDGKNLKIEIEVNNFDHHGNDWSERSKVPCSASQYYKYLIKKQEVLKSQSPDTEEPLIMEIILAEQKSTWDGDYAMSQTLNLIEKRNPELLGIALKEGDIEKLLKSKILRILVEILNKIDSTAGVPKMPTISNLTIESEKHEQLILLIKLMHVQFVSFWVAHYYTLNREVENTHNLVELTYKNIIKFIDYIVAKINLGKSTAIDSANNDIHIKDFLDTIDSKTMDEQVKLLLNTVFVGSNPLEWSQHLEDWWKIAESIYADNKPKGVRDIKEHFEEQIEKAVTVEDVEKITKILTLNVGDRQVKIGCLKPSAKQGEPGMGRAYLSMIGVEMFFTAVKVRIDSEGKPVIVIKWSILGELKPELLKYKRVIDDALSLCMSFWKDMTKFPKQMMQGGAYSGNGENPSSLTTVEEHFELFISVIETLNHLVAKNNGEIETISAYDLLYDIIKEKQTRNRQSDNNLGKSRLLLFKYAHMKV